MKNHGNIVIDNTSPSLWQVLLHKLKLKKVLPMSVSTTEPGKELVVVSTGRHHAVEGAKVGTFTFGGIRTQLSFAWLTQKRRRFTGKALYNGLTSKIYRELYQGDLSWTNNPGMGRHALVDATSLPSQPEDVTLQLAAVR